MWPNPQETADLVTFIGKILNRKLNFLCSVTVETANLQAHAFINRQFT